MLWDVDIPMATMSTQCQLSSKFKFQKKCLFAITLHEWTWLLFFYKQGLVSTYLSSDFMVFHSSSSSTFLNTYSYHYSSEINIQSNSIASSLILYDSIYKIINAIQSYSFLCNQFSEKRCDCGPGNQSSEIRCDCSFGKSIG